MGRTVKRKNRGSPASLPSLLREWTWQLTGEPLQLANESAVLLIVSTLDLLMTHQLLRHGFQFYESNPIARWWFTRWNIAGMTIFKFLLIGVAIAISEVVERRRPGLGRLVLTLGTAAAAVVVVYSVLLLVRHGNAP